MATTPLVVYGRLVRMDEDHPVIEDGDDQMIEPFSSPATSSAPSISSTIRLHSSNSGSPIAVQ